MKIATSSGQSPLAITRSLRDMVFAGSLQEIPKDRLRQVLGAMTPLHVNLLVTALLKRPCPSISPGLIAIFEALTPEALKALAQKLSLASLPKLILCLEGTQYAESMVISLISEKKLAELFEHMAFSIKEYASNPSPQKQNAGSEYRKALNILVAIIKKTSGEQELKRAIAGMQPKYMKLLARIISGSFSLGSGQGVGENGLYLRFTQPETPFDDYYSEMTGPDVYQEQLAAFGLDNFLDSGEKD
ncbi:MAG: hypothetical protein ABIJ26_08345 [Candidatus Margulisiibacteriota bacterium]